MRSARTLLRRFSASPRRRPVRLRLVQLESRVAPAVSLLNHLDGIGFNGSAPPDTCGAAGPNSYIETANSTVTIYNKTTNAVIASDGLYDFLYTKGGITPVGGGTDDATMIYDEPIGRFIVADLDTNLPNSGPSALSIAVSKTSNPTTLDTSSWNFVPINASEANVAADYPGNMGYNADAFVFTFNMFPTGFPGAWHTEVVAVSQSSLVAGGALTVNRFDMNSPFFTESDWSMRPVTMHDSTAGGPMWLVSENHVNPFGNAIDLTRIDNILTAPGISSWTLGVNSYGGLNNVLNPDNSIITTQVDSRIQKAAERYNDIVACQNVGVGSNEDDARWYEFDVSNINSPFLVQQGNVGFGPNTYTVFPAIDINPAGNIAMGFTKSGNDNSTDYMSTYITGQKWFDAAGTMETPVEVRAGDSDNNDGREGDFSGINVDPLDGTFWVADEYATGGTWGTEVANFAMNTQNFYVVNGQLQIYGDQLASNYSDSITVGLNGRGGVYAVLNGESVGFDPG